MKLITVSGPPSSGKTAIILKTLRGLKQQGLRVGVVKFDCLASRDGEIFKAQGIPALTGLAGNFCPDHYFITNIEDCFLWGEAQNLDLLISESAGLCNRCAPHIKGFLAVCVLDNLSGVDTPMKVGPMLKTADLVLVSKGDVVSQAEREVFAYRIRQVNGRARILFVNGVTGQGCWEVGQLWREAPEDAPLTRGRLRFTVPSAVCSYCFGQQNIGAEFQHGLMRKIDIPEQAIGGLAGERA